MSGRRVAVLGATGLVGREMLLTLEQRNFPVSELVLLASVQIAYYLHETKEERYR